METLSNRIKILRNGSGLTQEQLALKSGVPYTTLTKIESGVIKNPSQSAITKLATALGASLDDSSIVKTFIGESALSQLFADILKSLPKGEEMYISGIQEKLFVDTDKKSLKSYIAQLAKRNNTQKLLSCEGDNYRLKGKHLSYRWVPQKYFSPTPIYSYGDKVATIIWGPPQRVIILSNSELADAYKKQFMFMWEHAKPMIK